MVSPPALTPPPAPHAPRSHLTAFACTLPSTGTPDLGPLWLLDPYLFLKVQLTHRFLQKGVRAPGAQEHTTSTGFCPSQRSLI